MTEVELDVVVSELQATLADTIEKLSAARERPPRLLKENEAARYKGGVEMENLRAYRQKAGFTQLRASEQLKISEMTLCRYETGAREPRAGDLIRMAQLYGCTVDDLLNPTMPLPETVRGESRNLQAV